MRIPLLLLAAGSALGACASHGNTCNCAETLAERRQAEDLPAYVDAANFRALAPTVAGAGVVADGEIADLKARGYSTVIDLRMPSEKGVAEERAAAEAAGLRHVSIPVSGSNFMLADAARLRDALAAAPPGDVLLHCASGSRAGALWAMAEALRLGLTPEDAQKLALQSGAAPALAARAAEQLRDSARP